MSGASAPERPPSSDFTPGAGDRADPENEKEARSGFFFYAFRGPERDEKDIKMQITEELA